MRMLMMPSEAHANVRRKLRLKEKKNALAVSFIPFAAGDC